MPTAHLPQTLRALDQLDALDTATLEAVLAARASAGTPVSADLVLATVAAAASGPDHRETVTVPPASPPSRWKRFRQALGSWCAWEGLGLLALFGTAALAKHSAGGDRLFALMTSVDFSNLLMLLTGALTAGLIVRGTLATAEDGEVLGEAWTSIWVPVRLVVGTSLLLPLLPHGSLFSLALQALLGG